MYLRQFKSDKLTSSILRLSSLLPIALAALLTMQSAPAVCSSVESAELEFLFDVQRALTGEVLWSEEHNANGKSPIISNEKEKTNSSEEFVKGENIKIRVSDAKQNDAELGQLKAEILALKQILNATILQTTGNTNHIEMWAAKEMVRIYKDIYTSLQGKTDEISFENAGMMPKWVFTKKAKRMLTSLRAEMAKVKEQMETVIPSEAWKTEKSWWKFWG